MSVSQEVLGVWKLVCHFYILLISVDTSNLNVLQYYSVTKLILLIEFFRESHLRTMKCENMESSLKIEVV